MHLDLGGDGSSTSSGIMAAFDVVQEHPVSGYLTLGTQSQGTVTVSVVCYNPDAQFMNREYEAISQLSNNSNTITLSGTAKNVEATLENLGVNLNNIAVSDGSITVSDGLNPINTEFISGITNYLLINRAPYLNLPLQEQID